MHYIIYESRCLKYSMHHILWKWDLIVIIGKLFKARGPVSPGKKLTKLEEGGSTLQVWKVLYLCYVRNLIWYWESMSYERFWPYITLLTIVRFTRKSPWSTSRLYFCLSNNVWGGAVLRKVHKLSNMFAHSTLNVLLDLQLLDIFIHYSRRLMIGRRYEVILKLKEN